MNSELKEEMKTLEHKKNHTLQIASFFMFFVILILDLFILRVTTGFSGFVPLVARIAAFLIILILAFALMGKSHQVLFGQKHASGERHESLTLVTDGVFAYVRHPMYLGTILMYLAFIILTVSLVSLIPWIIIIIIYNYLANYEEMGLERIFGKDYLEYKKRVRKWIPQLF